MAQPAATGVALGFVGAQYAPCAIAIAPFGVGISAQGVLIGADVVNIGPTGAQTPTLKLKLWSSKKP